MLEGVMSKNTYDEFLIKFDKRAKNLLPNWEKQNLVLFFGKEKH